MFCPKCGQQQGDNVQFCASCGSPMSVPAAAQSAAPVSASAPASGTAPASASAAPSIIENYKNVLRKYATFEGRATRREYWLFVLVQVIMSILLSMLDSALGLDMGKSGESGVLNGLYGLVTLVPSVAVGVRRMHDIDRSGWWIICPIVNFIFTLLDGTIGKNRFGADPKGRTV